MCKRRNKPKVNISNVLMFSSISVAKKISIFLFLPFLFPITVAHAQDPSLVGTVEIQDSTEDEEFPEIIVTPEKIPQSFVDTIEAETVTQPIQEEPIENKDEGDTPKDKILAINALTDNIIRFPILKENFQINVASTKSLQIVNGPANLDIISTVFINADNLWNLGITPEIDTVKWEFSKNNTDWDTFDSPEVAKVFDTNVARWSMHNFYFRLHTPTKITSPGFYSAKITIIVLEPEA